MSTKCQEAEASAPPPYYISNNTQAHVSSNINTSRRLKDTKNDFFKECNFTQPCNSALFSIRKITNK